MRPGVWGGRVEEAVQAGFVAVAVAAASRSRWLALGVSLFNSLLPLSVTSLGHEHC